MKLNRRQSRETAFCLIFEWGFREDETLKEILEQAEIGRSLLVDPFAMELASKTIEHIEMVDAMIERYSKKWKLNRIPRVTRSVLRMSFCELTCMEDIPVGATINEAVELVKKFATEEDAAYVNGLLGQYERDRTGTPAQALPDDEVEVVGNVSQQMVECETEPVAVQEQTILEESLKAADKQAVEDAIAREEAGE